MSVQFQDNYSMFKGKENIPAYDEQTGLEINQENLLALEEVELMRFRQLQEKLIELNQNTEQADEKVILFYYQNEMHFYIDSKKKLTDANYQDQPAEATSLTALASNSAPALMFN